MKNALEYFALAQKVPLNARTLSVRLITNFTDATLRKLLVGVSAEAGILPTIHAVPYKQYHLFLKDKAEETDITFLFLDVHQYARSALHEESHIAEILTDIERYASAQTQPVIVATLPLPYHGIYGNLFAESPLYKKVSAANEALRVLSTRLTNFYLCDSNRLLHAFGEDRARDFRALYAFDIPFTNDFFVALSREWLGFIKARLGLTKKCLVVDLDNTVWGGIVGEVGPLGIELGPDYPGLAYQNFQRTLIEFTERGVILAINSRNNPTDVDEVFAKNKHMLLRPEHFAAVRINWNNKAQNIVELAAELNIGTDSMVFIDDDAMNRDLVRTTLPEVIVPDWELPPEEYVPALLALTDFYQLELTAEDRKKAQMYTEERQRKLVQQSAETIGEYIAALDIRITVHINDRSLISRISQMTMKTNQFNLTTKRYTEKEIAEYMENKEWVVAADVTDKFGAYGTTVLAIAKVKGTEAHLDTFLMSCRVMGRGVEQAFMRFLAKKLQEREVKTLRAEFILTAKNSPAKDFLPSLGCTSDGDMYRLNIADYLSRETQSAIRTDEVPIAASTVV